MAKAAAFNIFAQGSYDEVSLSRYVEGDRNQLGEAERTLTEYANGVKADIQPVGVAAVYGRSGRRMARQGYVDRSTHIAFFLATQDIAEGDVVTDSESLNYDVLALMDYDTHKEVLLRKMA